MAQSPPRTAAGGEGTHPSQSDELAHRRPGVALGAHRPGLQLRRQSGQGVTDGPVLWLPAIARVSLHVRPHVDAGLPSCSAIADGFDGIAVHLENHDVAFAAVSRAPLSKLLAYRKRMGWRFPWVSSADGRFNFDFNVSFTEEEQRDGTIEYNYARGAHAMDQVQEPHPIVAAIAKGVGTDAATYGRDRPGMSAFIQQGVGAVFHTYSSYARGLDPIWNMYQWLDRAPLGRNEQGIWWKRRDEYGADRAEGVA